jgi:2-iminobutanoate/2-iminopropanoate deaminase
MPRRVIKVPGLGHGQQPIPLAVVVNGVLVTGGIDGRDPETGTVPEDPASEVRHLFANLKAVLDAAGCSPDEVAKITVFVKDRDIRQYVNPEWVKLFPDPDSRPARHTLVQPLSGVRIQLDCLAVLDRSIG